MEMKMGLQAGVARRLITPPRGIFLIGYGDRSRGNVGVHDDLTATALVCSAGEARIGIVALDMLAINEYIVDRVRDRLGGGIEVILCCSHTHSGPVAYAGERSSRTNRAYIDFLVEQVCSAVREAEARLAPACLEWSQGRADISINRREQQADGHVVIGRNPEGPVDASVRVISVKAGGIRVATLVNYACHGTVLGPDNLLVSADWIGAMRAKVEEELGGLALFLQGATGDLNPDMYWNDKRAFEMVKQEGERVARAVISAVQQGAQTISPLPLKISRREAWLPLEAPARSARPPRNYARPLLAMARLPGWLAFLADPLLNQRYPWKPRIEAREGFWSVPMRINALRIGDLALATFGAEVFTEIGMKVAQDSPGDYTLFASLCDGCTGYLTTAKAHAQGGYEVDVAPLAYRYPGRLAAGCEAIALDTARTMLEELWQWQ